MWGWVAGRESRPATQDVDRATTRGRAPARAQPTTGARGHAWSVVRPTRCRAAGLVAAGRSGCDGLSVGYAIDIRRLAQSTFQTYAGVSPFRGIGARSLRGRALYATNAEMTSPS